MSVTAGLVLAGALWFVAVALMAWGTVVHPSVAFQNWGLGVAGAAMVAQVRHYFCRQAALFQNAFELGRDSALSEFNEDGSNVRPLR